MKNGFNMKYVDIAVTVLFVLALVVIYFFWGCELDMYITILAGIVVAVSALTAFVQNKKLNELGDR